MALFIILLLRFLVSNIVFRQLILCEKKHAIVIDHRFDCFHTYLWTFRISAMAFHAWLTANQNDSFLLFLFYEEMQRKHTPGLVFLENEKFNFQMS